MAKEYSIPRELLQKMIDKSEEKPLIDSEIIEELRKKMEEYGNSSASKKILLIRDEKGPHLIAAKTFDSLHVYAAMVYSMVNNDSSVLICGGGVIHLKDEYGEDKVTVDGESYSFGGMNINEVKAIATNMNVQKFEVDGKHMSSAEKGKYCEFSYARLVEISKDP